MVSYFLEYTNATYFINSMLTLSLYNFYDYFCQNSFNLFRRLRQKLSKTFLINFCTSFKYVLYYCCIKVRGCQSTNVLNKQKWRVKSRLCFPINILRITIFMAAAVKQIVYNDWKCLVFIIIYQITRSMYKKWLEYNLSFCWYKLQMSFNFAYQYQRLVLFHVQLQVSWIKRFHILQYL